MRLARWLMLTGAGVCLLGGAAWAAPVPSDLFGGWTDEPDCGPNGHRMVFSANTITVYEGQGHQVSVQVETSGNLSERLEVRVVKPSPDGGPKVGDVMVIQRQQDELHLLAQGSAGNVHDVSGVPPLHRCP